MTGALRVFRGDVLKHGENGRDTDTGAHEQDRVVAFLEIELTGGSRDVDHVADIDAGVQMVGNETGGLVARGVNALGQKSADRRFEAKRARANTDAAA